jgi:hypothetical protein
MLGKLLSLCVGSTISPQLKAKYVTTNENIDDIEVGELEMQQPQKSQPSNQLMVTHDEDVHSGLVDWDDIGSVGEELQQQKQQGKFN